MNAVTPALATADVGRPPRPRRLLSPHVWFFVGMLAALTLARVALMLWKSDRVDSADQFGQILVNGLRMDVVILSYVTAPAVLLSLALGGWTATTRWSAKWIRAYFTLWTTVILFMEYVTPSFIQEFDSRPNRLFIEYWVNPRELVSMLLKGYWGELILTACLTAATFAIARKVYGRLLANVRPAGWRARLGLTVLVLPLLFLGARSSLQHRPVNPSSVAFSGDHLVNDLCLSSIYSVAFAAVQMQDEIDASDVYGRLENDVAVVDEVRAAMVTVDPGSFTSEEVPTLHHQEASMERERPLNLVILLQESLGASFVGALGGKPVTQFLDTLRDEGWWFDHMYSTGTRSVRGIEAVVSGFLPTPARSVVKLGRSQQNFFTLADVLRRQGYHTQFIYGGESHFDNMKRFFTGNGFEEIIDEDDFEDPVFRGSWGACDEDIMRKAHESYLRAGDEPFFSLVFSVSNHSPWEYPEGRIEPYDSPAATRCNSVRYADYALGRFFEMAKSAPYWDNTIFVVVADHCSRVYGASLVPIEHFHIPAVILGPGIEPRRDERIVSQIDLGPTLLSLMGISSEHPMVGLDLTRLPADASGRAVMQYGSNHALLEDGRVVVHRPHLAPTEYEWDGVNLIPTELEPDRARRALAYALLPSLLYREQRYHLPGGSRIE